MIKDKLFPVPPLFRLIQEQSATPWEEMYKVFNMGHRMEIYIPANFAQEIIKISQSYNIDAQIIGHCEQYKGKSVTIKTGRDTFRY